MTDPIGGMGAGIPGPVVGCIGIGCVCTGDDCIVPLARWPGPVIAGSPGGIGFGIPGP
jgi:hypothetical protein